jgi:DNA-binding transcriptional LysR family regulator
MLELRHLRYFVAVAEELNFSRAAERLHMAQPPLSVAIRQLEQEIGTELFARTSREVKLTAAGSALLDGAMRTLDVLEGSIAAARRAGAGELGTLRLGFSWSARFVTLPAIGQAFAARHPEVTVVTEEMWNVRMPQALRSATIDVAISICPEIDRELSYGELRREPVVALLPVGHRLATAEELSLAGLADETFVLFPRELAPRLYDTMLSMCRHAGFEPMVSRHAFHSAGDTGTLTAAEGVALAPRSVLGGLPGIVAVPLAGTETLETHLIWHPEIAPPAVRTFRDVARGVFGERTALSAVVQPQRRRQ